MIGKKLLLASFVAPEKIDIFIKKLNSRFGITKENIFFFKILDEPKKLILTFKIKLEYGDNIDIKNISKSTTQVHKRGTAIYTINALNNLIIKDFNLEVGNINYKDYEIDWDKYQNNLILNNNGELTIYNIERVFL